jgi:hypothetical protein
MIFDFIGLSLDWFLFGHFLNFFEGVKNANYLWKSNAREVFVFFLSQVISTKNMSMVANKGKRPSYGKKQKFPELTKNLTRKVFCFLIV